MTSEEILAFLSQALRKVEAGTLAPGPANAMAALARSMDVIRKSTEIESRLLELERAAGIAGRNTA